MDGEIARNCRPQKRPYEERRKDPQLQIPELVVGRSSCHVRERPAMAQAGPRVRFARVIDRPRWGGGCGVEGSHCAAKEVPRSILCDMSAGPPT